jgi:hypothetical protein
MTWMMLSSFGRNGRESRVENEFQFSFSPLWAFDTTFVSLDPVRTHNLLDFQREKHKLQEQDA